MSGAAELDVRAHADLSRPHRPQSWESGARDCGVGEPRELGIRSRPKKFDEFTVFATATAERALARPSVRRGQQLFSGKTFTIIAVAGFNDFFGPVFS